MQSVPDCGRMAGDGYWLADRVTRHTCERGFGRPIGQNQVQFPIAEAFIAGSG